MSMYSALRPPASHAHQVGIGIGPMRIIVPGEATGNAYAVCLNSFQPGAGPSRHVHAREDEIFHILEGRLLVWCDGRTFEAGVGDTALLPRGVPHAFRVVSKRPARVLMTVVPGGFEHFFDAVAKLRLPDEEARLMSISHDYGIGYIGPPLED